MLAQTPPMGWNSWNTFGHLINEQVIREIADAMVDLGLRDAGYEYVVIDDCWSLYERDENDRLVPDPAKFPSGMKALSDYIHSKGLKFGMYSCAGCMTCARRPGSFDHEYLDAQTFADWGVDFLKYDFCYVPKNVDGPSLYRRMSMALKATGREILFSACNWGSDEVEKWIRSTGAHMYRSTYDIRDNFDRIKELALSQVDKLAYSGIGCFNDIDMLVTGMRDKGLAAGGGCTDTQYATHFALWCMLSQPLMIGCDIRNMTPETAALLMNKELIAIDQDPAVRPPIIKNRDNDPRNFILFKHLANDDYAIACINFSDHDRDFFLINFPDFGLSARDGYGFDLVDVITGQNLGECNGNYKNLIKDSVAISVPAHGIKVFKGTLKKV